MSLEMVLLKLRKVSLSPIDILKPFCSMTLHSNSDKTLEISD